MKRLDKNILAARMGLEKESLRVDRRGRLAQTSHPFPDDAELDVDFSGNQLEFVTDVCDSADEVWEALRRLHRKAARVLEKRETGPEYLWPFSNPPYVQAEGENPPMEFCGEKAWKTAYRKHLRDRYGTQLMLYSGIHFNLSFPEKFREAISAIGDAGVETGCAGEKRRSADAAYLNLAAWTTRYAWLIVYLFAASPVLDESYFCPGKKDGTPCLKYASPRSSEIGYWNDFEPVLDYRSLEGYVDSILKYTEDGTLMSPAELYYPVRLKSAGLYDLERLRREGVSHIEIRIIDENPYSEIGIFREDVRFLHLLMVYLASRAPKPFPEGEQLWALRDMKRAALFDDSTCLSNGLSIRENAVQALQKMEEFFEDGDSAIGDDSASGDGSAPVGVAAPVTGSAPGDGSTSEGVAAPVAGSVEWAYIREALDFQWRKLEPGGRPAEIIREEFRKGYNRKGLELAKAHSRKLCQED
ncbi:MAG: hypothetical protein U0L07_08315 [Clostridia bacterium]|nr:hypothetical protein [Clostridia bacterium]